MPFPKFVERKIHQFIRSKIYLPDKLPSPSAYYGDAFFDNIRVRTEAGLELQGLRSSIQTDAKYTLLYFHGNGGCAANRADLVAPLAADGADIIVADYRGYGPNPGLPNEQGLLYDAKAFWNYTINSTEKPIIVFGHSLGGSLAVQLIAQNPKINECKGLITLGMFSTLAARAPFFIIPFLPDQYDGITAVDKVKLPWRILHERRDEVTSYLHSKAIFDSKIDKSNTEFSILEGGFHQISTEKLQVAINSILKG